MVEELKETWANVTNPPPLVMQLMLLQKKEGFILAAQAAKGNEEKGAVIDKSRTAQWLLALWLELAGVLQRENQDLFTSIGKALAKDKGVTDHIEQYCKIMEWLDKKGIKWDTKQAYDSRRVEEENKAYQL